MHFYELKIWIYTQDKKKSEHQMEKRGNPE